MPDKQSGSPLLPYHYLILNEEPDFAEKLRILAKEIQAGEISQIGLDKLEAGELEAEIEQQITGQFQATMKWESGITKLQEKLLLS